MKHLDFAKLIEKFEGRLVAADEIEVAAHIDACGDCRAENKKLADFFKYSMLRAGDPVPQAVTAHILNIYQRRPKATETVAVKSSLLGALIFDDWTMAVNERYSGLDTRQMLFRVKDFDIDIRIELVGDKCRLTGQIFPEIAGATVHIASPGNTASADLNEFGEFVFDPVPHGFYDLKVSAESEELNLEKVPLKR
jgi:hypothetical protein